MGHLRFKAVTDPKIPGKLCGQARFGLDHPAALTAYQVQVLAVRLQVVAGGTVVQMSVSHETGAGKGLQVAVDRGGRQLATAVVSQGPGKLLRRGMTQSAQCRQHATPRSRQPQTGSTEPPLQVSDAATTGCTLTRHPLTVTRATGMSPARAQRTRPTLWP